MRVTFAGVGSAFDEHQPNTSILIESASTSLLADCGFTAAHAFWKTADNPLDLDAIYLSHFHGDHYFGVPALLLHMYEEGRTKPMTIIGQPSVQERIRTLTDLAYANLLDKILFDITFREAEIDRKVMIGNMQLSFAPSDHSTPCLAVRIDAGGKSVFYSGDGRSTEASCELAKGSELVIHESFSLEPDTPGHGTIASSIAFAREAGTSRLALVHIARDIRKKQRQAILETMSNTFEPTVILPEAGDRITV